MLYQLQLSERNIMPEAILITHKHWLVTQSIFALIKKIGITSSDGL